MNYFISTLNLSPDTREKISILLPKMKKLGFKNIEISSFHPYEENLNNLLIKFSKTHKLNILIHNFSPPAQESFLLNLCSDNDFIRHKTNLFIKERIDLTKKLGGDYYSFHAGFRVDYLEEIHKYKSKISDKKSMDLFIYELKGLLKHAEKKKVHIGVENHVAIIENKDNLILYGMNNWKRLFNEIKSKYLHLHLDVGHLKVSANEHNFSRDDFLKTFGKHVMAMHVHDNTGVKVDCHAPFSENFWFNHYKYLPNLKYTMLETKTYGDIKLINNMIRILEERRK